MASDQEDQSNLDRPDRCERYLVGIGEHAQSRHLYDAYMTTDPQASLDRRTFRYTWKWHCRTCGHDGSFFPVEGEGDATDAAKAETRRQHLLAAPDCDPDGKAIQIEVQLAPPWRPFP